MPDGFLLEMMELREEADAAREDSGALAALRSLAAAKRAEAIERVAVHFDSLEGQAVLAPIAQAIREELNVIRAFDRMLEQLDREAGGS